MTELIFPKSKYTIEQAVSYCRKKYGDNIKSVIEADGKALNHIIIIP